MIAIIYQFVPYLWISLILTVIITALISYAWKNRTVLGARYFLMTLILVEIWIAAQAMEMAAQALSVKIIWANIQYISIMLTPLFYLFLTLQLTRQEKWLRRRWLFLLLLIAPAAMNVLLWTDFSYLLRQNVYLDFSGSFPTIGKTYGPLFWVFAVYNYAITILTMANLISAFKEKITLYRKQIMFLFIALLLPVISNIIHITRINPFNVDTTPSFFGLSALIMAWGIFRYRLFDVLPIARSIIIQEMRTGMVVFDNDGRFLDINPAARKMLNIDSEDIVGRFIESELSGIPDLINIYRIGVDNVCELAFEINGANSCYEVSFTRIKDSKKANIGWLLQIYDITERKFAENIIQHAALHDALTGLPNRDYFRILFSQELSHARLRGGLLTVAFLDLDNFKTINDTHGHSAGDKVLCEVAGRLKSVLRDSDAVSRIGGDEFAIVLPHVGTEEKIEIIGNKIIEAIDKDFIAEEALLKIKASVGFSIYPRDGDNIDVLLKKADKAMYMAKGKDKSNFNIYREKALLKLDESMKE